MSRYEFSVNEDKTVCNIFLKRPTGRWVGRVTKAPGGHSIQEFAPGVGHLPVNTALAYLGVHSKEAEKKTLQELGY